MLLGAEHVNGNGRSFILGVGNWVLGFVKVYGCG